MEREREGERVGECAKEKENARGQVRHKKQRTQDCKHVMWGS